MRLLVVASLLALAAFPSSIAFAQAPPIVVIGPPPASSGPPPQAAPTVPPGYEIEGDLGGMHFRARITTPGQSAPGQAHTPPPPVIVAPPAPPPPIVVQAPPVPVMTGPYMVVQQQPTYRYPVYAQPPMQPMQPMRDRRRAPRLDDGMDFPARLFLDILGAGAGFGVATGIAYLTNSQPSDSGFAPTLIGVMGGMVPMGISIFGGSIAGGRGRYGGALLGELIGGGLSATILLAGNVQFSEPWEMIAAIAGPAILGALIGFESQHAIRTSRLEERLAQEGPQISGVSVAPTAQGSGALVGLTGTF